MSRSASSSAEMAANAIAEFVKNWAFSSATGAMILAASASSGKKRTSRVVGSDRAFETGRRLANSGLSDSIAWFRLAPRAANALPKPSRFWRLYSRVGRVEGVADVVELDLLGALRDRQGAALVDRLALRRG